jgi:hypothetical protein
MAENRPGRDPESSHSDAAEDGLRRYSFALSGVLILIGAAIVTVLSLTWNAEPGTSENELNSTLLQTLPVALGGGVLSFLTSQYQARQARVATEHAQRRNRAAHRREVLDSVLERATASYNGVKRARRLLRAQAQVVSCRAGRTVVLADEYDAQMTAISDLQLEFETLLGAARTQSKIFTDVDELYNLFREMESYLGNLVTEYEKLRPRFNKSESMAIQKFSQLTDFLRKDGFGKFATRFHEVQRKLRNDLDAIVD